jgi:DNA-binding transcriptional MerR regulator
MERSALDLQGDLKVYGSGVSTEYRIAEVARRSGFSPATLRYYEGLGLLPEPARTAAGYRVYDERVLDRLAFIARAKQLGCTLEEIADLSTAWGGGRCGPVQERLRTIVAAKLAEATNRIADFTTLSTELRRAAVALEQHRPEGPCDDRCGCAGDPSGPTPLTLAVKPGPSDELAPMACTLGSDDVVERLDQWESLLQYVTRRRPIEAGMRLEFGPGVPIAALVDLAAVERECCRFFAFAVTLDERGVGLEVKAPHEAISMVHALFGAPA